MRPNRYLDRRCVPGSDRAARCGATLRCACSRAETVRATGAVRCCS